eukprot:1997505-Prymnesium_polylepis.1
MAECPYIGMFPRPIRTRGAHGATCVPQSAKDPMIARVWYARKYHKSGRDNATGVGRKVPRVVVLK